MDGAGVDDGADVLARHADREIVEAVAVEVVGEERLPEVVAGLDRAADRAAARPALVEGVAGREPRPAAEEDRHCPRLGLARERLERRPDRELRAAVAVEVAGREREAEAVPRLG